MSPFTRRVRPSLKPLSIKVSSVHGALIELVRGYSASILLQSLSQSVVAGAKLGLGLVPIPGTWAEREVSGQCTKRVRVMKTKAQSHTNTNHGHQIRNVGGVERVDSEGHKVPPNESLHIQTKLSSPSLVPLVRVVLSRSDPFAAIIKKSGVLGFYFAPHWCLSILCVLCVLCGHGCSCEQVLCVNRQAEARGATPHSFFFVSNSICSAPCYLRWHRPQDAPYWIELY